MQKYDALNRPRSEEYLGEITELHPRFLTKSSTLQAPTHQYYSPSLEKEESEIRHSGYIHMTSLKDSKKETEQKQRSEIVVHDEETESEESAEYDDTIQEKKPISEFGSEESDDGYLVPSKDEKTDENV